MKKWIAMLLLLAQLLMLGASAEEAWCGYDEEDSYLYVTLGTFPQTADGERLPILWRVLSVEGDRAYLLSEYVLEARRIHGDYQEYANKPTNKKKPGFDGDFTQTELSLYLNGDFAQANFAPEELALLSPDETLGRFTLLTGDDLKNKSYGFTSDQSRKAWGTEYAVSHVNSYGEPNPHKGDDLFVYGHRYGSHSPYWTRSQSTSDARHARCTKQKGDVGRINVITVDLGMRPVCWLDLTKAVIRGGSGTMEDPYVVGLAEEKAE